MCQTYHSKVSLISMDQPPIPELAQFFGYNKLYSGRVQGSFLAMLKTHIRCWGLKTGSHMQDKSLIISLAPPIPIPFLVLLWGHI